MRLILDGHAIDLLENPHAFAALMRHTATAADCEAGALPAAAANERRSIAAAARRWRETAGMIEKRCRGRSLTVADARAIQPHLVRAQEALTRAQRAWNRLLISRTAGTA